MGIFGDDDSRDENVGNIDEVKISAPDPDNSSSDLKKEVESKFNAVPSKNSSRGTENVSIEDLYEQNERIISLLESIAEEDNFNTQNDGGSLNGVL